MDRPFQIGPMGGWRESIAVEAESAPETRRPSERGGRLDALPPMGALTGPALGISPELLLSLQRGAGNHAVGELIARQSALEAPAPRRCACGGLVPPGETECERCRAAARRQTPDSSSVARAQTVSRPALRDGTATVDRGTPAGDPHRPAHGRIAEMAVQRAPDSPSPPADGPTPAPATPTGAPAASADALADMRNVKRVVDEMIRIMGPAATTVIPVPDDLLGPNAPVAAATPAPAQSVATWPAGASLLRSVVPETGGKAGAVHPEGGVVGSVQACYDFMTGKFDVIAWLWAGAGVKTPFGWYGAYAFVEGELYVGNFGALMTPGVCDTKCDPEKEHSRISGHAGLGGGAFPIDIKPGNRAVFSKGGIELGVLFTPSPGTCGADLEVIGLFDIKKYLGPAGVAAQAAEDAAKKLGEEFGQRVECGAGIDLSVTAHLCRAADPNAGILGYTTNSIKLCGGGFIGCNINLSRNRAALPGGGH